MIYEYDLTVAAASTPAAPSTARLSLSHGIIHRLEVSYPPGCHNLVSVVLRRGVHQVWPTNPGGALRADAYTIALPVWEPLEEAPYELQVDGWAPLATYDHIITVRLGILPREVLAPTDKSAPLLQRLSNLIFGRGS